MVGRPPFGLGPIARVGGVTAEAIRPPAAPPPALPPPALPPFAPFAAGRSRVMPGSGRPPMAVGPARGFAVQNLRRNVCPHFYMTGTRGAIPIQAPHLLKGLVRQDGTTSRCQLRGGVHLDQGYVNDVCLSPRFNQCVFYEEDLTER